MRAMIYENRIIFLKSVKSDNKGKLQSATNKFRDWPRKTSLKQDIWIFVDYFIQNILLQFQYTCYSDSTVIQMRVLAPKPRC